MRVSGAAAEDRVMMGGSRDAESLFRGKPIAEIRQIEAQTRKQIEDNKEELRQLVGNRYRDLIDSANSIVLMKSSCRSISSNISSIHHSILSLSEDHSNTSKSDHQHTTSGSGNRFKIYGVACRVKYLVDTPENIWGCLDESMFLEASARYVRANHVHHTLNLFDGNTTTTFPLLQHQWQIVESFKSQISQKSRERLFSDPSLSVYAYADALAAVAVIDELRPAQVLALLLDSRKSWILQALSSANLDSAVISVLCQVMSIIQVSVGQVGELFLHVLSDMPLFYKVILESPPASQLYGGIPNPNDEIRLWKTFRNHLESSMVVLDKNYISKACSSWLRECRQEVVDKIHGRYLIDAIRTGRDLELAEKSIRETINSKQVLEGSLDWLKTVFGSEIELPWSRIRELMLEEDSDLWDEIFEDAFVQRMKAIIDSGFEELSRSINVGEVVSNIGKGAAFGEQVDFQVYLSRPSTGGGVWFIEPVGKKAGSISSHKSLLSSEESDFRACLNSYLGPDVCQIRDAVDKCCQTILEDLMHFLESPNAAQRLKTLAPYIQAKCYETLSAILTALKIQLDNLYSAIENKDKENEGIILAPPIIVERALFIGRLLFAIQNHSKHIPILLGSPRFWINETVAAVFDRLPSLLRQSRAPTDSPLPETPGRQTSVGSRKQTSFASAVLLGANESASPKLEELSTIMGDLCIRSHSLWISWLSDELSVIFSRDLGQDEGLSSTTSLRGWEEVAVKQEQPDGSPSEMKILLPSMPSLYVISFLFRACEEIHRIGGHVLDRTILKKFALRLLETVIDNYRDCISAREANGSNVSEKGILQVLLDLRFASDVLSGGDFSVSEELPKSPEGRYSFRRKQESKTKSVIKKRVEGLIESLSQRLDPIDWLTYEPYLWENERQSYLRHAVLFGFFIQLNRLYTDTVQKLSTNSESNIMRCSTVPRFQYLPISAPALSTRGVNKTSVPSSPNDLSSRNPWKDYTNGELSHKINLDENSSFGVATPFLKSFMQVGSRFGESTLKLGSILTDGQVGIFKDRSASAMSTFGDILPVQAAGLLSSFTTTKSDS